MASITTKPDRKDEKQLPNVIRTVKFRYGIEVKDEAELIAARSGRSSSASLAWVVELAVFVVDNRVKSDTMLKSLNSAGIQPLKLQLIWLHLDLEQVI